MIANFKPTRRTITIASVLLLVALGCLTFTRALDKPPAPPAAVDDFKYKSAEPPQRQAESAERRIAALREMLDEQDARIRKQQQEVDAFKRELGITQLEEAGDSAQNSEALRKLESVRVERRDEYQKIQSLYKHLSGLPRPEFKRAVSTASPDQLLTALLEQQATTEQKLASLMEKFSAEHPEVKGTKNLLSAINTQVNDRLDGILEGLKARVASEKAALDQLDQELAKAKATDIDRAIKQRPYFQAKHELETMRKMRDQLAERLMQEKINAALGK